MEKLLKFCLSVILITSVASCDSKQEKVEKATEFGFRFYQGEPNHMNAFAYAIELDSTKAENWRELSVTYLKRGIPHEWKKHYDKAVAHDPETWQPWRGYLYLWFYRDYKNAIADFDASDTLTPNFIDTPQGHSVDYWRGIAYLGLKDYKNSIAYFDKHIKKETEESGEDWVEINAFLYRGIAYYESKNIEKALENFDTLLRLFNNTSADAKYYKALILKEQQKNDEALNYVESAINDYNLGYYNNRPYVETLRQIYPEDLESLRNSLNKN